MIFVDTDVCIDLLSGRKPFNAIAEKLFSLADNEKIRIGVSSLSFSNIDYILRSQYGGKDSRIILAQFKTIVKILPVDSKTIDLALTSGFTDFEDAIQYYCAIENDAKVLVTRNVKDYRKAIIDVLTPESFLMKKI
jgi:predicted nucleic acid-binding protein